MTRSSSRRFAYQLAVKLGRINVNAMLRSITAKQFIEWEAYARLEPFNELRADARAALIASYIFNMAVNVKDRKELEHFMLNYGDKKAQSKQTPEMQVQMIEAFVKSFAAKA